MMGEQWTVRYCAGREATGVEAEIAEMNDCEPYNLATVEIPEIGFRRIWDDRDEQEHDFLAIAHLIAAVHAMYEALEAAANTLISLHSDDEDFRYTGSEMDSSSWDDPEAFETFCQISAALADATPPAGKDDEDE